MARGESRSASDEARLAELIGGDDSDEDVSEAQRLAALMAGDDSDDDDDGVETEADQLRMAQLLGRRGISEEDEEDDEILSGLGGGPLAPPLAPPPPPPPPEFVVLPPEAGRGTKTRPEVRGIGATTAPLPTMAQEAREIADLALERKWPLPAA